MKVTDAVRNDLIQSNKHLIPMTLEDVAKYRYRVCGAKNVKKDLAKHFPGVKFSVTSEQYSMGDSIHVYWNDPIVSGKQVREVIQKYQQGHYDSMTDMYGYETTPFCEVFGGAKYVHGQCNNW